MPRFEPSWHTVRRLPARGPAARWIMRRSRIEPEPGNDGERVAVACVNRDPFSRAAAAVDAKFRRAQWHTHQAGAGERVRDRARTIVTGIVKRLVSAAVTIRLGPQLVRGPDHALHRSWRVQRREGEPVAEDGRVTGRRRSRCRK